MKRILLWSLISLFVFTACGGDDPALPNREEEKHEEEKPDRTSMVDLSGYVNSNNKRGIGYNKLNETVVKLMGAGNVRWAYNWATESSYAYVGAGQKLTFMPMVWGSFSNTADIETGLAKSKGAQILLGFNEPMMTYSDGGCQLSPKKAAELWPQVEMLAEKYGMKLASPALTYGYQAIDGKVYGTPEAWMNAFISEYKSQHGHKPTYDYLALHSYMNWSEAVVGYVDKYAKMYGKKVLLTEFCAWGHNSDSWDDIASLEKEKYKDFSFQQMTMTQKIEAMDQDDNVAGYAWFMADGNNGKEPWNALYADEELTQLGLVYTYLSNHNTEKFYKPGVFIPAVQYVSSSNFHSKASKKYDTYLLFGKNADSEFKSVIPVDLRNLVSGRFVEYQIDVPEDGQYQFTLRMRSDDTTSLQFTTSLGTSKSETLYPTFAEWKDQVVELTLKKGQQVLKIAASSSNAKDVRLSCLMFKNK